MTAHTHYEQTKNRYLELTNLKKQLEIAIAANVNDTQAITQLRSDYRTIVDELEQIYTDNINYFSDEKIL